MKYKVGDRVRVKEKPYYSENANKYLQHYGGVLTIKKIIGTCFRMLEKSIPYGFDWVWSEDEIAGLAEGETKMIRKNYIPETLEMMGLHEDMQINIAGNFRNPYTIKNSELFDCCGDVSNNALFGLLVGGEYAILPWEPRKGEYYYYVNAKGYIRTDYSGDCMFDYMAVYCGNCFRTREEAEANKSEVLKKLEIEVEQ